MGYQSPIPPGGATLAVRDASVIAVPHHPVRRVAMLVVHSNPVVEPGVGDAGGMTVYVRQMARSLAARGLDVDIYTRRDSAETPDATFLFPGVVVHQIAAGAPGISKGEIPAHLPEFTANLLHEVEARGVHYDLIHSHYWLSGRAARRQGGPGASRPGGPAVAPAAPGRGGARTPRPGRRVISGPGAAGAGGGRHWGSSAGRAGLRGPPGRPACSAWPRISGSPT